MHRKLSSPSSSRSSSPSKKARIPASIDDSDYVDRLVQDNPSLERFRSQLNSYRDKFQQLKAQDNVDALLRKLSQTGTAAYVWPTTIPKPSLPKQTDRFFGPSDDKFFMLGRALVQTTVDGLKDWHRVFLYGPRGVGKSHVLAAVALYLSACHAKGKPGAWPVCYIPDMKQAMEDDKYVLWCLMQSFIDQPIELNEVAAIGNNVPALMNWLFQRQGIIVIADQCNEVPDSRENWARVTPKAAALDGLIRGALGFYNKFLFAASSDQTKVDVFDMSSGADNAVKLLMEKFSNDEYREFVTKRFPDVAKFLVPSASKAIPQPTSADKTPELVTVIEEVTGFVPLQVYELCLTLEDFCKQSATFTAENVRDCIVEIGKDWTEDIAAKIRSDFYKEGVACMVDWKVRVMAEACGGDLRFKDLKERTKQLDWRYFYPEGPHMVAKVISKLALGAVISATVSTSMKLDMEKRKKGLASLRSAMGLDASVRGFVIETIINESLKIFDWRKVVTLFKFPENDQLDCGLDSHKSIKFGKDWENQLGTNFHPTLLIPASWQYKLVDSIIVYQQGGCCYVIGIQITTHTPQEHGKSLGFVTDDKNYKHFVPQEYQTAGKHFVGLLWIVHEKNKQTQASCR